MKRLILLSAILAIFFISTTEAKPIYTNVNFNVFYSSLSPHGEWIEVDYDIFVWRPYNVPYNWQPYSDGAWIWTSEGWYWDSYEPFGWATYHYGRWYYDDFYGWVWMPGNEWAPAWVEWRYNNDYIGWAPLPPYASFRPNFGIHFSIGWYSHYSHWRFVNYHNFHHSHVHKYFVPVRNNYTVFNNTKYRTNYYSNGRGIVNGGVDRSFVEKRSGQTFKERNLQTVSDPRNLGSGRGSRDDVVRVYKPSDSDIQRAGSIDRSKIKSADKRSSIIRDKEIKSFGRSMRNDNSTPTRTIDRNNSSRSQSDVRENNSKIQSRSTIEPRKNEVKRNDAGRTETRKNEIKKNSSSREYNYYKPKSSVRENSYKLKTDNSRNDQKSYSPKVERKTVITPNGQISRRERSVTPQPKSKTPSRIEVKKSTPKRESSSSRSSRNTSTSKSSKEKTRKR